MSQIDTHELISAYLDGELDSDQRAGVERLLRESEQHRRFLSELRILSGLVKSLPRSPASDGFAESVVGHVERSRSLAEGHQFNQAVREGQPSPIPAARDVQVAGPGTRPSGGPRGIRRGVVWATVAVAASLLMALVYGPLDQQPANRAVSSRGSSPQAAVKNQSPTRGRRFERTELVDSRGARLEGKSSEVFEQESVRRDDVADATHEPTESLPNPEPKDADKGESRQPLSGMRHNQSTGSAQLANKAESYAKRGPSQDKTAAALRESDGNEPYLVVVELPRAALDSRVVDATFLENGIVIVGEVHRFAADNKVRAAAIESLDHQLSRRAAKPATNVVESHLAQRKSDELLKALAESEVMVVHATPQQIDATVAGLAACGYRLEIQKDQQQIVPAEPPAAAGPIGEAQTPGNARTIGNQPRHPAGAIIGKLPPIVEPQLDAKSGTLEKNPTGVFDADEVRPADQVGEADRLRPASFAYRVRPNAAAGLAAKQTSQEASLGSTFGRDARISSDDKAADRGGEPSKVEGGGKEKPGAAGRELSSGRQTGTPNDTSRVRVIFLLRARSAGQNASQSAEPGRD